MSLTAGQAGDNPQLLPLVDGYFGAEHTTDSASEARLVADKAYSHPSTRTAPHRAAAGFRHTIPERDDQIARRKAKGSAGGRHGVRRRNLQAAQHRRMRLQPAQTMARWATRYDCDLPRRRSTGRLNHAGPHRHPELRDTP